MAEIIVTHEAFVDGRFPPVCCKTGLASEKYVRWKFTQSPGWTWILLPFGVIPFVIARAITTREYEGVLPVTVAVERRVRRAARVALVLGIVGVALVVAGILDVGWSVAGFALLVASGILILVGYWWSPGARLDLGAGTVSLSRVHDQFVAALLEGAIVESPSPHVEPPAQPGPPVADPPAPPT